MGSTQNNLLGSARLDSLLSFHVEKYTGDNPKSVEYHERARKVIPGGTLRAVLSFEPFPLTFSGGHDCFVISVDGKEYLDFVSEYNAGIYGHSHPAILDAIDKAAKGGFNLGGPNEREVELAEKLLSRFPSMDSIRFTNSGTEANTMAIATALNFVKRQQVLVFRNGYHGGTLMFGGHNPLNLPHDWVLGSYNDVEATRPLITEKIGVILVEPMLGAGGNIPGTRDFLSFLREEANRIGAILIFDEIITSRLYYGGYQEHMGIIPDMTTIGKHFGGGFSFGAFGGKANIMAQYDPKVAGSQALHHSGTWNNNMFSMSAGCVGVDLLSREELERTARMGQKLRDGFQAAFDPKFPGVLSVSGISNVMGFKFLNGSEEGVKMRHVFYLFLISRGIYVASRGMVALNITHQDEHIDRLLEAAREFCDYLASAP